MPGGDGTGPRGLGPMRGRGRGWGRHGWGWGRHGWGWVGAGAYPDQAQNLAPKQEADMLREQAKAMQEEIKNINACISELDEIQNLTPQQEADMLKEQTKTMQDEIKAVNERISELESLKKKSK